MKRPDKERIARGIAKAQAFSSWESTVATMQSIIKEAIRKPDRPEHEKGRKTAGV